MDRLDRFQHRYKNVDHRGDIGVPEDHFRDLRSSFVTENPFEPQRSRIQKPAYILISKEDADADNDVKLESRNKTIRNNWRPWALRRRTISIFLLIFCLMLAALEYLRQLSDHRQGLATTVEDRHYLWTFGPTAILTIIAAYWNRVEYRSAQMAPWKQMAGGRTSASKTLLLDYISSFQLSNLATSLKNAHYMVFAATAGSLAIRLMIIVSTGLLALQQQAMITQDASLVAKTSFTGTLSDLSLVETLPLYVIRGLQTLNLPYPAGTTSSYAVQSFKSLENMSSPLQLIATVNGFSAELECETADIDLHYWYLADYHGSGGSIPQVPYSSFAVSTSTCTVDGLSFPQSRYLEGSYYASLVKDVSCAQQLDGLAANRLLVSLTSSILQPATDPSSPDTQNVSAIQSTQIICKPTYKFGRVMVTAANTSITEVSPASPAENTLLPGISEWDVAATFLNTFKHMDSVDDPDSGLQISDPFLWTTWEYPANRTADFFDASLLKNATQSLYSRLTTQIVQQSLLRESKDLISGTIQRIEDRLVVRVLSLRILEGLTVFMILVAVCLMFTVPTESVVPHDSGSIGGMALVIPRSYQALHTLRDTGSLGMSAIKAQIFGIDYWTATEKLDEKFGFRIHADVPVHYRLEEMPSPTKVIKWWHPIFAGRPILIPLILFQLSIIATLEVTLRLSQNHEGLADVHSDGYLSYVWSLLPAFVLSCIAALYASIAFFSKVYAPFCALRSTCSQRKALRVNYLDKTAVHAMWEAASIRQFAVLGTTLGALLGSFLTIAVSGVFTIQTSPYVHAVDVEITGWFNTSDSVAYGESLIDAFVASALVVEGGLSYPPRTYGEFAFPYITINDQSITNDKSYVDNATSLSVKLPALRSKMDCAYFKSDEQLNASFVTIYNYGDTTPHIDYSQVMWNASDDPFCSGGPAPEIFEVPVSNGTFGLASAQYGGCQPMFVWGKTSYHKIDHIASMTCNNTMERVDVDVTFNLPDFSVDSSKPPVADENTAEFFTFPDILDDGTLSGGIPNITVRPYLDSFFGALVDGKDGFPDAQLGEPEFDQEIAQRIRHLTALLRAVEYNVQARSPAYGSLAAKKISGVIEYPYRTRLLQTDVSTRIVQGLLGAMVILAVASNLAMSTREALPKNPCSIAGVASLLVDSTLLHEFEHNADVTSSTRSTRMFGLGWFESGRRESAVQQKATHRIPRKPVKAAHVALKRRFGIDIIPQLPGDAGTTQERERERLTLKQKDNSTFEHSDHDHYV